MSLSRQTGIAFTAVRPWNLYGPGQRLDDGRVPLALMRMALSDGAITLQSDGTPRRSPCFAWDGLAQLAACLDPAGAPSGPVNIGNPDDELSIAELARRCAEVAGLSPGARADRAGRQRPGAACGALPTSTACGPAPVSHCLRSPRCLTDWNCCGTGWPGAWPMLELPVADRCRLSGEPLADAPVLLELADCPLPGIYPDEIRESLALRSPLRVVRAPGQRAGSARPPLRPLADTPTTASPPTPATPIAPISSGSPASSTPACAPGGAVLEVGCGDGTLLELLRGLGHHDVLGIDPGRAAAAQATARGVIHGFFPDDLPPQKRGARYERVVLRHVLEHIETPREFVAELAACLAPDGELWIEVPDLDATLATGRWSNFYQLHCNYFDADTLDTARRDRGSAVHRRARSSTCSAGRCCGATAEDHPRRRPARDGAARAAEGFAEFQDRLAELAANLPANSAGYGAAERTALTLGRVPGAGRAVERAARRQPAAPRASSGRDRAQDRLARGAIRGRSGCGRPVRSVAPGRDPQGVAPSPAPRHARRRRRRRVLAGDA